MDEFRLQEHTLSYTERHTLLLSTLTVAREDRPTARRDDNAAE